VTGSDYRGLMKRMSSPVASERKNPRSVNACGPGISRRGRDDVAHDVTQPGSATLSALVDAFGSAVLDAEGSLDRVFVADVVFHDASALRRLNAITHAPIGVEIARRLDGADGEAVFAAIPSIAPSTAPCSPWTRCGPCRYRRDGRATTHRRTRIQ